MIFIQIKSLIRIKIRSVIIGICRCHWAIAIVGRLVAIISMCSRMPASLRRVSRWGMCRRIWIRSLGKERVNSRARSMALFRMLRWRIQWVMWIKSSLWNRKCLLQSIAQGNCLMSNKLLPRSWIRLRKLRMKWQQIHLHKRQSRVKHLFLKVMIMKRASNHQLLKNLRDKRLRLINRAPKWCPNKSIKQRIPNLVWFSHLKAQYSQSLSSNSLCSSFNRWTSWISWKNQFPA